MRGDTHRKEEEVDRKKQREAQIEWEAKKGREGRVNSSGVFSTMNGQDCSVINHRE